MNVLVFAPHPDDEVIGCGGSLIYHQQKNDIITVVYITSGDAGSTEISKKELSVVREREATEGMKFIGITNLIFLQQPDGYVEYNLKNIITITNIIRKTKPDLIYLPHSQDAHRDHFQTYLLVTEAVGRAGSTAFQELEGKPWSVSTVLGYEVWTPLTTISFIRDISEYLEKKISTLQCHHSQLKNVQYDEATRSLNRYRGIMTQKGEYCECFQVVFTNKIDG
jgi:LmbE family N-acetylglucosaminyl deacetylase